MGDLEQLAEHIRAGLGASVATVSIAHGEITLEANAGMVEPVIKFLRDDPECAFSQLIDLCGVDYPERALRFDVVYHLLSIRYNWRLRVKVYLQSEPPKLPTVSPIWPAANWFEREAFDLFGVMFEGHPDLRRILTDYGFVGHPFRKDFPLEGKVEVRYDPDQKRVVSEPVSIEPRTLVPKVIREEDWLHSSKPKDKDDA